MPINHVIAAALMTSAALLADPAALPSSPPTPQTKTPAADANVPPRTQTGDRLAVPDDQRRHGTLYHVVKHKEPGVRFVSQAELEKFEGASEGPAGYLVISRDKPTAAIPETPPKPVAGAFRLAAASLKTGLALRDEHLLSESWLNAERFPDITFAVAEARDIRLVERSADFERWSLTLVGDLTIRGVKQRITIEKAELRIMPKSDETKSLAPGDLMTLTCAYDVRLRDFGIDGTVLGLAIAERIKIEQTLLLSTE